MSRILLYSIRFDCSFRISVIFRWQDYLDKKKLFTAMKNIVFGRAHGRRATKYYGKKCTKNKIVPNFIFCSTYQYEIRDKKKAK